MSFLLKSGSKKKFLTWAGMSKALVEAGSCTGAAREVARF